MAKNLVHFFVLLVSAIFVAAGPTAVVEPESKNNARNMYISDNTPKVAADCNQIVYACKKKLPYGNESLTPASETYRPCVKYCVKFIKCANNVTIKGKPNECVELNEQLVREEYSKEEEERKNQLPSEKRPDFMPVALIDFPCQPGHLPDRHGKCRPVIW